ncbi:MAG: hypothetical protein K2X77_31410 [Candidatus Obscuribacterales bacterium]|jgi:hypothetical protein|nr:hypothetical protein [Candidatus Obscuribacterales bacterium]
MSVVFSVPFKDLPSPLEFMETFAMEDFTPPTASNTISPPAVICPQLDEGADLERWERDFYYTFYVSGISTRGLEIWLGGNRFFVRIPFMAVQQEWFLALRFLELAAEAADSEVKSDWRNEPLSLIQLREAFEEGSIKDTITKQGQELFELVLEAREEVSLNGPIHSFCFGPQLADKIIINHPYPAELEALIDFTQTLMKLVQYFFEYPNFEKYQYPEYLDLPIDGNDFLGAVLKAGTPVFVSSIDYLVVPNNLGGAMALPADKFRDYLGQYFKEPDKLLWLDEYQFALAAVTEREIRAFAEGVAEHCVLLPAAVIKSARS